MSSLFDQLSASGGAERTASRSNTTSSYYHNNPKPASQPRSTDRWSQRKQQYENDWDRRYQSYMRGEKPRSTQTRPQSKQQPPKPHPSLAIRTYNPVDTSRPYAYEPIGTEIDWVRPTWQDVLKDLAWKMLESAIAAVGMAVAEFFLHRRFHPGPGVRW